MKYYRTILKLSSLWLLLICLLLSASEVSAKYRPRFVDCPPNTIEGLCCEAFQTQVKAVSRGWPKRVDYMRYRLVDGPGQVNPISGLWRWQPTHEDCGHTFQVEISATDIRGTTTGRHNCRFHVTVIGNRPPRLSLHPTDQVCGSSYLVPGPGEKSVDLYAHDSDSCQRLTPFIASVTPHPVGTMRIVGYHRWFRLWFAADSLDAGTDFQVVMGVTDGIDTAWCDLVFQVRSPIYRISIEKTEDSYQGQHEYVDVTMEGGIGELGGFDLLLVYDRSALNFQTLLPGSLFDLCPDGCGWEYFNFRIWFWPSYEPHFFWAGIIHVIGIAELNNGAANHPCCFRMDDSVVLFTIDFLVTDNRLFECQFAPIRFFWTECGDNTLATRNGDSLLFSRSVFEFEGTVITPSDFFPSYGGAIDECLIDTIPHHFWPRLRLVDYQNGGVDIRCQDSVRGRGDVNLNGLAYEVADLMVLTNYFIYGFGAFQININGQMAAADINSDGQVNVADLVLLGLVITGMANPDWLTDTTSPHVAAIICDGGTITIETPDTLGAAFLVCEGNQSPTLLQDDMNMNYAYDADENITRVLISFHSGTFTGGPLLSLNGCLSLREISMATYNGAKIQTLIVPWTSSPEKTPTLPVRFALHQNYPNPFNNGTVIQFDLPQSGQVDFEVINVLGKIVYSVSRSYPGGRHQIEWNGTDNTGQTVASGVYYYRVRTPQNVQSKKMVLLK